jgi:hypothetical protein
VIGTSLSMRYATPPYVFARAAWFCAASLNSWISPVITIAESTG